MILVRLALVGFVSVSLAMNATAGELQILADNLTWKVTVDPSPEFIVELENATGATDKLFGWMLGLNIVPSVTAVGSVQFASASIPTSYILDGGSSGLTTPLGFSFPATSMAPIADSDQTLQGVTVSASGANLLSLTFVADAGARGDFFIYAVGDEFQGSSWFSDDFSGREFANVPFGGEPVLLATLHVTPEPSSGLLAWMAFCVSAGAWWARCRLTSARV